MPLYEFKCAACGTSFEAQVPHGQQPACPCCGAAGAERVFSAFAGPFTVAPRGTAARRSDAARRAREERRAQRREQRRQSKKD
jgi:putative FmdB family regulatory protein